MAYSVPVATAVVRIAIQDVFGAFRRDAQRVQRRAVLRVYRVPAAVVPRVSEPWLSLAGAELESPARRAS